MKQNILNNLIYQVFTKTIKKRNLPIVFNKTRLKQIDSLNTPYVNHYDITNKNDINKIDSNKTEIFNDIVGYDDIKKLFLMSINSEEPIHIALAGPPASAKTIFMKSLMETGIVSETKFNKTRKIETKISIFATCNDLSKIIYPIRSRFLSLILKAYSYEEFHKIVTQLLSKKNLNQKIIDEIVYAVWYNIKSKNIRDCIKIAQMAKSVDDILFLVKIYEKYNVKKLYS